MITSTAVTLQMQSASLASQKLIEVFMSRLKVCVCSGTRVRNWKELSQQTPDPGSTLGTTRIPIILKLLLL